MYTPGKLALDYTIPAPSADTYHKIKVTCSKTGEPYYSTPETSFGANDAITRLITDK